VKSTQCSGEWQPPPPKWGWPSKQHHLPRVDRQISKCTEWRMVQFSAHCKQKFLSKRSLAKIAAAYAQVSAKNTPSTTKMLKLSPVVGIIPPLG